MLLVNLKEEMNRVAIKEEVKKEQELDQTKTMGL
jgi:hypothetical protein